MGILMGVFKAASGREVKSGEDGSLSFDRRNGYLSPRCVMDAEEFFRAKRDAELGRWRWPLNPDYVVYRDKTPAGEPTDGTVVVIHEPSGDRLWADPDGGSSGDGGTAQLMREAAFAYFVTHPFTRKPWQGAEAGEVWVITVPDRGDVNAEIVTVVTTYGTFTAGSMREWALTDPEIRTARQIEVSS